LSYTTFVYSDLRVARSADGGVTVSCRVRNSGKRDGDAVVQAYLGAPAPAPAGVDFAVHALAAFARVSVKAGGVREVRLQVAPERLRYWSLADHAWHTVHAGRRVYVGASSRDLPLSAPIS
jgi:beta-glucosidase